MTDARDRHGDRELTARIADYNGRPSILVDGVPVVPVFYGLTHSFGGRLSWEEVPQRNLRIFGEAGVRLYQVDLHFQDIWTGPTGDLDIEFARHQIAGVLHACRDAAVVLRVHVNAPYWWNEAHPDECTEYADGAVEVHRYGPPFHYEDGDNRRARRASLASKLWRREAGERLRELCTAIEASPEGRAVIGFHIAGGIYGEWHYWGFIDHDPDIGLAMTRCFRAWLTRKYGDDQSLRRAWGGLATGAHDWTLDGATVPDTAERDRTTHGVFRDPHGERRVIDYFTCQQEVVADDIECFAQIIKTSWSRPVLVGVFYGYLHGTFSRQAVGGHLCIERILRSRLVDYISAPPTYYRDTRGPGGSGNSRGLVESAILHRKLWLDEVDNGHLQPDPAADFVRYRPRHDPGYLQVLRRSAVTPMLRGGGFWYYDFGASKGYGWWDSEPYLAEIARMQGHFRQWMERPHSSEADVLFVWSMDSFYFVKPRPSPIADDITDASAEEALRCGVAGDHVYDFDLERVNLSPYRAVVFMNTFCLSPSLVELIRSRVAAGGRTVIWNYLAGVVDGERFDMRRVHALTGIRVRTAPFEAVDLPFRLDSSVLPSDHEYGSAPDPMAVVADDDATVLASIRNTDLAVVAERRHADWVSVLSAVPLRGTALFRSLLARAGCHVYASDGEVVVARCGLVAVHSIRTGAHELTLRSGTRVTLAVDGPTTVVVDGATGRPVA